MSVVEVYDTPGNIMEVEELPEETPNYIDRSLMLAFVFAIDVCKAYSPCYRKTTLELADGK
jgi:hypothetical protein